ncbi:MAG: YybH family protein [Pseudomonadales bacterium]
MASGVLILLLASLGFAESSVSATQKEIDRTVWKEFQSAFERLDGEALNAVYADTVLRVTPEGLDTNSKFKLTNGSRFKENITNGDRISLDFWFDSRHTNMTTSYDVGFYRVSVTTSLGATTHFYGQFHIVLRKIKDHWKIVQDWDTASIGGRPITAEDFARQSPVEF